MIKHNNKDVAEIHHDGKNVAEIYKGDKLVWTADSNISCFAGGYWVDENPWTDNLPWKDKP